MHTDDFLYRFRSVFAAGRALDKVAYVESHAPKLLIMGNSRADNGFDPRTVGAAAALFEAGQIFNLGLPGADTRVLHGVLQRLEAAGRLGGRGIEYALISLDEALIQRVDTLGQEVFFAPRGAMLQDGQYRDFFRASLHLYGFTDNLRQLREPGTLVRFARALREDVEPVGGAAATHLGYRAGFGGLQNAGAALRQETTAVNPPDAVNVDHFWRILDLLERRGVRVAVVYPPLLNRNVLYATPGRPEARAYAAVVRELKKRNIPILDIGAKPSRPDEFVNAGHLNDKGAQKFSREVGRALHELWHEDVALRQGMR